MGTLTDEIPKPMLPLFDKPMLEWKLEMLPDEIDEVVLVVGYLGETIREYFGEDWRGRKVRYVEQKELNGTGGAILLTRDLVRGKFLVTMGDDLYTREDLEALGRHDLSVLAYRTDEAEHYGLLDTDETGNLASVIERPHDRTEGFVNAAAYILDGRIFSEPLVRISEKEHGLPQMLVELGKKYPVKVVVTERWQPVGKPEDIALGEEFLRKHWIHDSGDEIG